jgi:ribose/xylose/arabinose/galactoside ABC-type transport system permease subunit
MILKAVIFLAVVLSALALIPYGAHLFSLPNKIGMTREQYFVAQSAYDGWALLSVILIPAMLVNVALALMLRGEEGFGLAVAGCIVMVATLAVFFAFTYPANVATQNWKVAPSDWAELRHRWEYSHAANAGLIFASFCLIVLASLAALAPRR